jgi:hypothetical protein
MFAEHPKKNELEKLQTLQQEPEKRSSKTTRLQR